MLSILSRWLIQFCFCLMLTCCATDICSTFVMISLRNFSSPVYPLTLLTKHISAPSRPVFSHSAVTHVSLPYGSVGLATSLYNLIWVSLWSFFKYFNLIWNMFISCQNPFHLPNSVHVSIKLFHFF
jgi:hypothetical protein